MNVYTRNNWKNILKRTLFLSAILYGGIIIIRSIILYTLSNGEFHEEKATNYLDNYYFTFGHVKEKKAIFLDSNNVYMVDYSKIKALGVDNEVVYNPVTIGLNALRNFQKHVEEGSSKDYEIFISNALWLVKNQESDGAWYLNQDVNIGSKVLEGPWCSALSQGLGISVLVRAHKQTGSEEFLTAARKALIPFTKSVANNGVRTENDFGICYEEYPLEENSTHVLNGFIYALFGLNDLANYDHSELAQSLLEDGLNGLKNSMDLYDTGSWTRYSLNEESNLKNHYNYASPWYQKLHVNQMKAISYISKEEIFQKYAEKFDNQTSWSGVNLIIYPAYAVYTDLVKVIRLFK